MRQQRQQEGTGSGRLHEKVDTSIYALFVRADALTARRRRERVAMRPLASCAKRASMTGEMRPSIISDSSVPRFLMPSTCWQDK